MIHAHKEAPAMKAIHRAGTGLIGLLLAASVSFGYVFVTPVYKCPYPQAPNMCNTGPVYYYDAWGRLIGPYYYLRPPCQPFNGVLPGPTGQAIMSGNLPHTLLLSKEGLAIGHVPLIGQQTAKGTPEQGGSGPGAGLPDLDGPRGPYLVASGQSALGPPNTNLQIPYGRAPMMQSPYGQMQAPYPAQMPFGAMPHPMQTPYGAMPYPMQGPNGAMPYPVPYGAAPMPIQPRMPMAYYPMSNGNYVRYYDPRTGIAQAQNMSPVQPFMPIPGFGAPPQAPTPPGAPGMDMGGPNAFQTFGPMEQSERLNQLNQLNSLYPLQRMEPPMPAMQPMQLPRMDYMPPPPQKVGGNVYPTHPFVRGPRDFFMWGENMEDEERARRRPFPVP
jgi:hypothetical protein